MIHRVIASVLVFASACEHEDVHERSRLFRGEWISIDGWDREAEETCAGTFEYLDTYAGMLAAEFDVEASLGVFCWSSWAHFVAGDLPCDDVGTTCAKPGEVYSPFLPHEHEVVHLANYVTGMCPSVLAEGLAVYYDTRGAGSASGDLALLSARLKEPEVAVPFEEYAIAGRFVAFLVHEFGLPAVLDVCATTGRWPDAAGLSSAMEEILGVLAAELVEQLAAEPGACNEFGRYQSRLYACGDQPGAVHAGVVEPVGDFVATYSLSCEHEASIGPRGGDVRLIQQLEFAESGSYRIHVEDADGDPFTSPPVTLVLAQCGYCGEVEDFRADFGGHDADIEAGRYWLELRAPTDFVGAVELTIHRQPW